MDNVRNLEGERVVEELLGEFNRELAETGVPPMDVLERCPEEYRDELRELMNTAALLRWSVKRSKSSVTRTVRIAGRR